MYVDMCQNLFFLFLNFIYFFYKKYLSLKSEVLDQLLKKISALKKLQKLFFTLEVKNKTINYFSSKILFKIS